MNGLTVKLTKKDQVALVQTSKVMVDVRLSGAVLDGLTHPS